MNCHISRGVDQFNRFRRGAQPFANLSPRHDCRLDIVDAGHGGLLHLSAAGEGPQYSAIAAQESLGRLGLGPIVAWWPDTDGICLAGTESTLLVFLAFRNPGLFQVLSGAGAIPGLTRR
jgi:hypothetical protein